MEVVAACSVRALTEERTPCWRVAVPPSVAFPQPKTRIERSPRGAFVPWSDATLRDCDRCSSTPERDPRSTRRSGEAQLQKGERGETHCSCQEVEVVCCSETHRRCTQPRRGRIGGRFIVCGSPATTASAVRKWCKSWHPSTVVHVHVSVDAFDGSSGRMSGTMTDTPWRISCTSSLRPAFTMSRAIA